MNRLVKIAKRKRIRVCHDVLEARSRLDSPLDVIINLEAARCSESVPASNESMVLHSGSCVLGSHCVGTWSSSDLKLLQFHSKNEIV